MTIGWPERCRGLQEQSNADWSKIRATLDRLAQEAATSPGSRSRRQIFGAEWPVPSEAAQMAGQVRK